MRKTNLVNRKEDQNSGMSHWKGETYKNGSMQNKSTDTMRVNIKGIHHFLELELELECECKRKRTKDTQ